MLRMYNADEYRHASEHMPPRNGAKVVARAWVDPAYRARVVREPRPLLREMGLDPPADVEVRVWDTTAETRSLVLPLSAPQVRRDGWKRSSPTWSPARQ